MSAESFTQHAKIPVLILHTEGGITADGQMLFFLYF